MWLKKLGLWDQQCFQLLFSQSENRGLNRCSFWCSRTGDGPLYVVLTISLYLLQVQHANAFSQLMLLSFSLELPLYLLLKNSIRRRRPYQLLAGQMQAHIIASDRFSFPSGHTAAAFITASSLLCFYPLFGWLALLWAALIGLSRIMLGVHFPLDIVAGCLLGVCCNLVAQNFLA